jgi:hypothetical protein
VSYRYSPTSSTSIHHRSTRREATSITLPTLASSARNAASLYIFALTLPPASYGRSIIASQAVHLSAATSALQVPQLKELTTEYHPDVAWRPIGDSVLFNQGSQLAERPQWTIAVGFLPRCSRHPSTRRRSPCKPLGSKRPAASTRFWYGCNPALVDILSKNNNFLLDSDLQHDILRRRITSRTPPGPTVMVHGG